MRDHPPKTAMRIRLEAERRANPQPPKCAAGEVNPADRPAQDFEAPGEVDATGSGSRTSRPAGFRSAESCSSRAGGVDFVDFQRVLSRNRVRHCEDW